MKTILVLTLVGFVTISVFGDTTINAWTKPSSGNWEEQSSWSLGVLPNPSQSVYLTNTGWKAVAIGPSTVQNFSNTLDVSSVTLGGYTDSFNLLLLNYAGFVTPIVAGSINVGTNSGITALASVLAVSSNSGPGELSIFNTFNQGENATVNAHVMNLGDVTNAAAGFGTYNQTNGIINADEVSLANGSMFNQFDGANAIGTLWMGAADSSSNYGQYNMADGWLTADLIEIYRGAFNQTGGSVAASLGLGATTYRLSGGILNLPGITIPNAPYSLRNPFSAGMTGDAILLQTGGTNFCNGPLEVYDERGALINQPFWGPGSYVLSNGVLSVSSTVRSWMSSFEQWGGWHTNGGTEVDGETMPTWAIRSGSFTLGGGNLITPSISVRLGDFTQSGGTNNVSGEVNVGATGSPATFELSGGLLTDLAIVVDGSHPETPSGQHAIFTQSGGTHIVTNLLRLYGWLPDNQAPGSLTSYVLSNGALTAPNIQIDSRAYFEHDGGTLTTSGLLTLGDGAWHENTSGQQFGQLRVSASAGSNAVFALPPGNCIVRFANSSTVAWSNQATLLIQNWHGSTSGGGATQIYFDSDSSGLTVQQLAQIRFDISGRLSSATILATGEVVPVAPPTLEFTRSDGTLNLSWPSGWFLQSATNVAGPYQDVGGVSSPYLVSTTGPQRFFRLRN